MTDVTQLRTAATRLRERVGWVDHAIRAGIRYDEADGGRLAAALTYYAFFAVFACVVLGFAALGFVLEKPGVLATVNHYLSANLPRLDVGAIRADRNSIGLLGFLVLPVSGLFWVDATRSSIRAIWRLDEYPGRFFRRRAIDLSIFLGLGALIAVSLSTSWLAQSVVHWVVVDAGNADGGIGRAILSSIGFLLGLAVNTLLAVAMLTLVPRIHICRHRVLPPALLVAVGLAVLNTLGQIYVRHTEANPAYQVVAAAVGLLVFLSLLNQLILYAAALTATSVHGSVRILTGRQLVTVETGPEPGIAFTTLPPRHLRRRQAGRRPPTRRD
jgi:membrane protein